MAASSCSSDQRARSPPTAITTYISSGPSAVTSLHPTPRTSHGRRPARSTSPATQPNATADRFAHRRVVALRLEVATTEAPAGSARHETLSEEISCPSSVTQIGVKPLRATQRGRCESPSERPLRPGICGWPPPHLRARHCNRRPAQVRNGRGSRSHSPAHRRPSGRPPCHDLDRPGSPGRAIAFGPVRRSTRMSCPPANAGRAK
jgi:hypothetical protein